MRRPVLGWLALAAFGVTMVMALPALATPPPQHDVITDLAWFADNWALPDIDCRTFTIRETVVRGRQDMITRFDDAGEAVRVFEHTSFDGVLTNLQSGKTLRDHSADNSTFPIVNGDFSIVTTSGLDFHYTVAHQGIEIAVTGRLVHNDVTGEVLFVAGPHDVPPHELPKICPLLAS